MIHNYNPSDIGYKTNGIYGFPFDYNNSKLIILPVEWDVTCSYKDGTSNAPEKIKEASFQLDIYNEIYGNIWEQGIYLLNKNEDIIKKNKKLRNIARSYIKRIENNDKDIILDKLREEINEGSKYLNKYVYNKSKKILAENKILGILGGEHSVNYGLIKALSEKYKSFSIIHIDAHADLRKEYMGLTYSHASTIYNILNLSSVKQIIQIGIRDYCEEEVKIINNSKKVTIFTDNLIKTKIYNGTTFNEFCRSINVKNKNIYISFDIDGLSPVYCPYTGTPVPGGLDYNEAIYLLNLIVSKGHKIIGFDLCEVGYNPQNDWDANVGARILFNLSMLTLKSQQ